MKKVFLSEQRKGEIALAMLIEDLRHKQQTLLRTDILKKVGKLSSALAPLKISRDEILNLYRDVLSEIVQSAFGQKYFWEDAPAKKVGVMSSERKGEIALQVWKLNITENSLSLDKNNFNRKIGNVVQALADYNISKEEVVSLYRELVYEAMEKIFS